MCLASTSVTMPSSRANDLTMSSTKKVCATGAGSAIPVVSMTMPSRWSLPALIRLQSFSSTTIRSWRTVQQMQPFIISMISSSACIFVFFCSSASSIPTSPNSFSMTASFLPCDAVRMWLSSVVLPLPRKPVRTVTGTRVSAMCLEDVLPADAQRAEAVSRNFERMAGRANWWVVEWVLSVT